jgi:hypothetical protein
LRTLKTRILNACTAEPRTTRQVQELLQVPLSILRSTITNLLRDGTLHYAGMSTPDKGRKLQMYTSIRPMRVPHLTVWRGPLPTEWRI